MPYQSNDQLPDGVKDNLPADGQTIWRNAFNAVHKDTGDEQKAVQAGWGAVKNAGFEKGSDGKWTKASDDNEKTHSFDAEIFSTGVWNGDKYTIDDLENMVENFNSLSGSIKPPVKLGHNKSKINDGAPALGWVKGLRIAGNKLIASLTDVPSIVYEAIKKGLYKRISSEIYWNLKHSGKTFKRVLSAVALLGADIPAVKDLEDLQAFLTQQFQKESFDDLKAYSFEAMTDADVISIKADSKKEKDMADELKILSDKIDALTSTVETLKEENKQLEKDKKDAEKKYSDLKTDIDAKERQSMVDDIKAFCEDLVKKGTMMPAQRDVIVGEDVLKVYNEGSATYITFDQFKKFADLSGKQLDKDEKGIHDNDSGEITDALQQFTDKVEEYVTKHSVTYAEAYSKCLKLYPKLAEAYTKGGD
jgi:cation transport regulator ChaB/FtsZ-binding cell division protein ZapB